MQKLIKHIHVNIPFTMLYDTYLDLFLEQELNPEIGIDARALDRFSFSDFQYIFDFLKARRPEPPVVTLEPHEEAAFWPSLEYLQKIWPW